jgi:hypothetical protein
MSPPHWARLELGDERSKFLLLLRFAQDHELLELIQNNEESIRSLVWRRPPQSPAALAFGVPPSRTRQVQQDRAAHIPGPAMRALPLL